MFMQLTIPGHFVDFFCFRPPLQYEVEAVTDHLLNLLNCDLAKLPLELLTDEFLKISHTRPKKLKNYAACIGRVTAENCKKHLKGRISNFNGKTEIDYCKYLHNTSNDRYDVNITEELSRPAGSYPTKELRKHQHCLQEVQAKISHCRKKLIDVCSSSRIQATKLIRLHMTSVENILAKDSDLKFILYTRDPRAIIDSEVRHRPHEKAVSKNAPLVCEKMRIDLRTFETLSTKYPSNMYHLVYDDIVANPNTTLAKLYDFLGEPLPDTVLEFYHGALGGFQIEGHGLSTVRKNGTKTSLQWRKSLTRKDIKTVENACRDVIQKLNYQLMFP